MLLYSCLFATSCSSGGRNQADAIPAAALPTSSKGSELAASNSVPVIHVFVALCDNVNQGIVPVSPSLGNGDNPATNLYWGAAFGVKTFFKKSKDWKLVSEVQNPKPTVLERLVFKHKQKDLFMIADAYRGKEISQTIRDFLEAAAGWPGEVIKVSVKGAERSFNSGGSSELLAYVGHDGLMDFKLHSPPQARDKRQRKAMILACISKEYFASVLKPTGAEPLLWTTNLMAPEAYILSAAFEGWTKGENNEQTRQRAAKAYNSYQNCGPKSANNLFATGW